MLPHPNPTVIFKPVSDGAVLFAPSTEIYYGLNEVGARVWQGLPPASQSLDELCASLAGVYPDVAEATLREDVQELLDALIEAGLAVTPPESRHDAGADAAHAS